MARKPRIQKNRRLRSTFFVFCEGKSEKAYVEFLRQSLRPKVQLQPIVCKSNISEKEIKSHLSRRDTIETDQVFLMYDIDVPGMYERVSSIKGALPLLSNPCIELWYLLHFTDYNKCISSKECLEKLIHHVKEYEKGNIHPRLYSALLNEVQTAIMRAKRLQENHNPSTTIWRLLEILINQ